MELHISSLHDFILNILTLLKSTPFVQTVTFELDQPYGVAGVCGTFLSHKLGQIDI